MYVNMRSAKKRLLSAALCAVMTLGLASPAWAAGAAPAVSSPQAEEKQNDALTDKVYVTEGDAQLKAPVLRAAAAPQAATGFLKAEGYQEGAYATWPIGVGVSSYTAYVAPKGGSYVKLDKELVREYPGYMRADALGLKAGTYTIKVVDDKNNEMVTDDLTVIAHERTGFAFVGGTSSGAYNEDGTLKSNAQVLYVTKASDISDKIVDEVWNNTKNKYTDKPMCIRVIGHVTMSGAMGFQGWTTGLTVEGVGSDALLTGGGVFIKGCSNVEVRNLGVMHVQKSGKNDLIAIEQKNDHVWVHNCDLFYGFDGSGDQAKGDGSLDVKESHYCSFSYNHFWDSGKCSLLGMHKNQDYMTYHHNWFDHSDSRHPRIRIAKSVHIYNNYYDGVAKYGVGAAENSGAFVEANYFRNTRYPMLSSLQGSDVAAGGIFSSEPGGIIKAYNNKIIGAHAFIPYDAQNASKDFDAYVAKTRDEKVPSSVAAKVGGTTYSNFDTTDNIGVTAAQVQSPDDAMLTTTKWAGRVGGGDLQYVFNNAVEDTNYSVIPELNEKLNSYKTTLVSVGGTVTKPVSGGDTPTHTHTPGAWRVTKVPGCNKDTQALVPGEETQSCTVCGEILDTRPLAGAHSNDGQGKCQVCGATVGNGGGPTVSADSKVLNAVDFIMHETTGSKNNTAAMRAEDMAAVAGGYFAMNGSSVNKRTKDATTVGAKAEWIDLPKSGNGGIQFTVTNVPADVNVSWGNTGGGQTSSLLIKTSDGTQIAAEDYTADKSSKTSTSVKLTEQGTYIIASKPNAGYSVRLYQLTVTEAEKAHDWGEWVSVKEATCGEDGVEERTCSDCGKKETRYILATENHTWGEWVDGNDGEKTRTCSVCGETETESGEPTPPPVVTVDKTALNAKLEEAAKADENVSVSANGSDVPTTGKWATQAAFDALDAAVKAAQAVADKKDATQNEVDAQVTALTAALAAFQPKAGTKPATTPGSDSTFTLTADEMYSYVTAQRPDGWTNTDDIRGGTLPGQGTGGFFTVYSKASGGTSGSKFDKGKKFDGDNYNPSNSFSFGGNVGLGDKLDTPVNGVKFTTDGTATVKVWWIGGGKGTRTMTILDDTGKSVVTSKESASDSTAYISTLTLDKAGTYYLGPAGGSNKLCKVEVTVTSSGDTPVTPDADKTALNKAITAAETARRGVVASVDGTDVVKTDFWATQAALDVIDAAITEAKKVARQAAPTQAAVDAAVKALNDAVTLFSTQKAAGKKDDGTVTPPPVTTQYTLTAAATSNGTVSFRVAGSAATKAAAGATVTVVTTPASGYKVGTITTTPAATVTNGTFTMPAANVTVTVTFVQDGGGSGSGSFGGGGGGGSASSNAKTETLADGTTVTTTKGGSTTKESIVRPDGTRAEMSYKNDGSATGTITKKDGTKATVTTTKDGETTVKVTVPAGVDATNVSIPVKDAKPGTVAVIVKDNGKEELVRMSAKDEAGVVVRLDGSATVKLVDRSKTFVDVPSDYWAEPSVDFVAARELFNGTDETHFTPNGTMTRGMMATVLFRLDGARKADSTKNFTDVAAETWYTDAVAWANDRKIVTGYSDGTFGPHDNVTREQLAVMLYRYAKAEGLVKENKAKTLNYADADQVGDWAVEAVSWLTANGIMTGKPGNLVDPKGNASRAEVAAVLERFVELVTEV